MHQAAGDDEGTAELAIDHVLRVLLVGQRRADQQHALVRQAHGHRLDLLRLQAELGAQRDGGVDAGMAVAAGGIGLHRGVHQLELVAEALQGALRRRVRGIGPEEAGLAFEGLGGAAEALARQGRGGEAVHRAPADLEALGPGAVGQELQAAGGLGQGDAEGVLHALGIQPEDPGGGGGGTEGAAGGGRVVAAVVVVAAGQGQRKAAGHLIAGDDGREHGAAVGTDHLGRGQRGGDDRGARVQGAGGVGVVEVEAMRQGAVQQRRAGRGVAGGIAEDGGAAGGEAEGADHGQQGRGAFRIVAAADDVADQIQHEVAGAFLHFGRQGGEVERRAIGGDGFGDGGHGVSPG